MTKQRNRTIGSIKSELLKKSREAALSAVQIFNNPNITFKSESYLVLMVIAWTYLLHSYYRSKKVDYRYYKMAGSRKRYDTTSKGAHKYWELERSLNDKQSPVDKDTANNLRFLIGLRHEVEHQMTTGIDDLLSARFQACCLNFNETIKRLFGDTHGIDKHLSFSLQFSSINEEQQDLLSDHPELPKNIQSYILDYDKALSDEEYGSPKYAYRILFVPKTANRKGQADKVIEFVKPDSEFAKNTNIQYAMIKETERRKHRPGSIVDLMKAKGYKRFNMHTHTTLWQDKGGKDPSKGYGVEVEGSWFWYDSWIEIVEQYCRAHPELKK